MLDGTSGASGGSGAEIVPALEADPAVQNDNETDARFEEF